MIDLEEHGPVWLLRMTDGENRFNAGSVRRLHGQLDRIEDATGPLALVTTGDGKFYSNGLDLDAMAADPAGNEGLLPEVHRLLGRVLGFPAVTVAAINGHAFAAGAMLAAAHDYSVMRADRGYWCLPEADLGLPLTAAMYEVVKARLPLATLHDAVLSGRRYGGAEAVHAGIVTEVAAEEEVVARALALAAGLASKDRSVIARHKQLMYGRAAALCLRTP